MLRDAYVVFKCSVCEKPLEHSTLLHTFISALHCNRIMSQMMSDVVHQVDLYSSCITCVSLNALISYLLLQVSNGP